MGEGIRLSKYRTLVERQRVAQRGYTQFLIRQHQKRQVAEKCKRREESQKHG